MVLTLEGPLRSRGMSIETDGRTRNDDSKGCPNRRLPSAIIGCVRRYRMINGIFDNASEAHDDQSTERSSPRRRLTARGFVRSIGVSWGWSRSSTWMSLFLTDEVPQLRRYRSRSCRARNHSASWADERGSHALKRRHAEHLGRNRAADDLG